MHAVTLHTFCSIRRRLFVVINLCVNDSRKQYGTVNHVLVYRYVDGKDACMTSNYLTKNCLHLFIGMR